MRKVKAFMGQYFYDRDCSVCGRQIVVVPNGDVGIYHTFYGSGEYFAKINLSLIHFPFLLERME